MEQLYYEIGLRRTENLSLLYQQREMTKKLLEMEQNLKVTSEKVVGLKYGIDALSNYAVQLRHQNVELQAHLISNCSCHRYFASLCFLVRSCRRKFVRRTRLPHMGHWSLAAFSIVIVLLLPSIFMWPILCEYFPKSLP
jgi:hypothetical protein